MKKHFAAIACVVFAGLFYSTTTTSLYFVISGERYGFGTTRDVGSAFITLALFFELRLLLQFIWQHRH